MSATISVDEAQADLRKLIHQLAPGEVIVITENQQPIAKLTCEQKAQPKQPRPGPGLCKGMITYMAPDFDASVGGHEGIHGMNLLLDTHTFLWHANGDSKLSRSAMTLLSVVGSDAAFDPYGVTRLW